MERSTLASPIFITAGISVAALVLAFAWSATRQVQATGMPSAAASANPLATQSQTPLFAAATSSDLSAFPAQVIGVLASQYAQLQQAGAYTPALAQTAASSIAPEVKAPVSYRTYTAADIKTTPDTSYARMQQYQADMKAALAPLGQNTTPEIAIVAAYNQTKDQKYLAQLAAVAQYYADSVRAASQVEVPQDAVAYHVAILNAMGEFGATLSALAQNSSDPLTSMALLNTYNGAEADMVSAFDRFADYVKNHPKP